MISETIGLALIGVAVIVVIAGSISALTCVLGLQRTQKKITSSRAFLAIAALPAQGERIASALQPLASLKDRIDGIGHALRAALESGAKFGVEVDLAAQATQDLLDAFAPSIM